MLMRAGLSAQPRPPGVRLSRAPLDTWKQTRPFRSIEKRPLSELCRSKNQKTLNTNPGANWEEAISPGFSPAAAAIAAKLALVGNWAAPCRAADNPGAATIKWPVPKVVAMDVGAWVTMDCA